MHKKYYSKEELKIYYFTAGPTFPFQYQIFNKTITDKLFAYIFEKVILARLVMKYLLK